MPQTKSRPDVDLVLETLLRLYAETRRVTNAMASRYGLTRPQLSVLKLLESSDELSLSDLSNRIHTQNSTLTGIIDRMQGEGLVVRSRSIRDRRVVHIRLTPAGRDRATSIPSQPADLLRDALATLSEDESRALLDIASKLARHMTSLDASLASPSTGARTPRRVAPRGASPQMNVRPRPDGK